jgi:hypothetical protein
MIAMRGLFTIRTITFTLFFTASVNFGWQFYRMYREGMERQQAYEQFGVIVCKFGLSRDEASRMYVEFFLLFALMGAFVHGLKSTLLTVFGLTGVTIFYMRWWRYYFLLAEISGSEMKFLKHTAYLVEANYLDIFVALLTALLIGLHVHRAVLCLGSCQEVSGKPQ